MVEVFMFEKENQYFRQHEAELRKNYAGKKIVIAGDRFIGAYDDNGSALAAGRKVANYGNFMIKELCFNPADEVRYIAGVAGMGGVVRV
jgi:hypothetical protein